MRAHRSAAWAIFRADGERAGRRRPGAGVARQHHREGFSSWATPAELAHDASFSLLHQLPGGDVLGGPFVVQVRPGIPDDAVIFCRPAGAAGPRSHARSSLDHSRQRAVPASRRGLPRSPPSTRRGRGSRTSGPWPSWHRIRPSGVVGRRPPGRCRRGLQLRVRASTCASRVGRSLRPPGTPRAGRSGRQPSNVEAADDLLLVGTEHELRSRFRASPTSGWPCSRSWRCSKIRARARPGARPRTAS
jgi:hypothetical protein